MARIWLLIACGTMAGLRPRTLLADGHRQVPQMGYRDHDKYRRPGDPQPLGHERGHPRAAPAHPHRHRGMWAHDGFHRKLIVTRWGLSHTLRYSMWRAETGGLISSDSR